MRISNAARSVGSRLVMIGILPTLTEADVHEDAMSGNERYRVLNEQIFAARGEDMEIAIEGAEPLPGTPEQYGQDIDREETQWAKVIKASGAKAE